MRTSLATAVALFITCSPAPAQSPQWVSASEFFYNPGSSKRPIAVYASSVRAVGTCFHISPEIQCNPPPDVWIDQDVIELGLVNAKAAFLSSMLVITPNTAIIGTPLVAFECRVPGSSSPHTRNWNGYTIGQSGSAPELGAVGARTPISLWCPVVDGKIEWMWHNENSAGGVPDDYLVHLSLQAWVR
jgi:hypothetical protein